jgi:hypothetical protein
MLTIIPISATRDVERQCVFFMTDSPGEYPKDEPEVGDDNALDLGR